MNFEIIYKKIKSFISRIANKRTIYGKVGREQAIFPARKLKNIRHFLSENDVEYQVKSKKTNFSFKKNIDVFFKLNFEGELLLYKAFCLDGEYCFSFYDDDQDPFSNVDKVIDAKRIKEGFSIQIGKSYNFSY